jgi:hypothetical protein
MSNNQDLVPDQMNRARILITNSAKKLNEPCKLCQQFRDRYPLLPDGSGHLIEVGGKAAIVPPLICAFEGPYSYRRDNRRCQTMLRLWKSIDPASQFDFPGCLVMDPSPESGTERRAIGLPPGIIPTIRTCMVLYLTGVPEDDNVVCIDRALICSAHRRGWISRRRAEQLCSVLGGLIHRDS